MNRSFIRWRGLPDDQKQSMEKDYIAPKVDDPAAKALRVLLGTETSALTGALRGAWTRFMIASLLRRPAAVAEIGETFKSTLRQNLFADSSYESDKQEGDPPTRFEWMQKHHPHVIDDAAKEMVVRAIESNGVGNIIINMQWSTLDMSASRHELLTGDRPQLRYYGLKDPRCTILFPLTPTKLFIATHDRKAEHNINRRNKIEVVISVKDEVARIAERFVYGRTASQLRFVANRLGRTPSRLLGSNSEGHSVNVVIIVGRGPPNRDRPANAGRFGRHLRCAGRPTAAIRRIQRVGAGMRGA